MSTTNIAPIYTATIDVAQGRRFQIFPDPTAQSLDTLDDYEAFTVMAEQAWSVQLTVMNGDDVVDLSIGNMPTIDMHVAAQEDPLTSKLKLAGYGVGSTITLIDGPNGIVQIDCPSGSLTRYYATDFESTNDGAMRISFTFVNAAGQSFIFQDNINVEDNEYSGTGSVPPSSLQMVVTQPLVSQEVESQSSTASPLTLKGATGQSVDLFDIKDDADTSLVTVLSTGELNATVDPTTDDGVANKGYNDGRYQLQSTPIADDTITDAMLVDMPTLTIKGNSTGGTADPENITVPNVLSMLALNLVDNIADANKPVSTPQQTALDLKLNAVDQAIDSAALGGKDLNSADISNARVIAYDSGADELIFVDQTGGGGGSSGIEPTWDFSTATVTTVDPTSGVFNFDNATILSATEMAISNVDKAGNIVSPVLAVLVTGAMIRYVGSTDATTAIITVSSAPIAEVGFYRFPITVNQVGATPANLETIAFEFMPVALGGGNTNVLSVFERTGPVGALAGDYSDNQITNTTGVTGAYTKDAIDLLNNQKGRATALGVGAQDDDMGTFTGSTISDNVDAKVALQELEVFAEGINTAAGITHTEAAQGQDNDQTVPNYTLVLTDQENKTIWMLSGASQITTIPLNSSVAFPLGTKISVMREGVGTVAITGATGVTVNGVSAGSVSINNIYQGATLSKRGTDIWIVTGDIT